MEETQLLLDDIVLPEEIQRYRVVYEKAAEASQVTDQNKFSFAYCLVRSKAKADVRSGLQLLRELYDSTRSDDAKRDYLYYSALGNARLNEYEEALKFLDAILFIQPGNHQAKNLKDEVTRRMNREGYVGMGIAVGAGALLLGGTGLLLIGGGLTAAAVAILKK
ncbi:unnamed protein product [Rotaria socialis]|uniref:Mitochondrial fission 1 protein n=1 Tax=Rotaria socialis TaxID=392032 RepID=A0A818A5R8_9BILA|nr:unnamed protein product [Rotaria socialis]CAF3355381.1 unnamed protein product [Rotaria socialis]CAF3400487.1 unnamed protein product [Rotaria socialis]CAF3458211.1 unnamed protein product [Rotaria socialis]CAF3643317.1 unnamed protein product [Rotaria socialis]